MYGNFACGEYPSACRRAGKLDALCAEDANPYLLARLAKMGSCASAKKAESLDSAFLAPATGIEPITTP